MRKEDSGEFDIIEDDPSRHDEIDKIAKEATKKAFKNAKKAGVAVTYREGDRIITEFPDGKIEIIETNTPAPRKVKKGTRGKL